MLDVVVQLRPDLKALLQPLCNIRHSLYGCAGIPGGHDGRGAAAPRPEAACAAHVPQQWRWQRRQRQQQQQWWRQQRRQHWWRQSRRNYSHGSGLAGGGKSASAAAGPDVERCGGCGSVACRGTAQLCIPAPAVVCTMPGWVAVTTLASASCAEVSATCIRRCGLCYNCIGDSLTPLQPTPV